MNNNPQYSGIQPLRPPPIVGSMDPPRNFASSMSAQFRSVVPAQQSQQFVLGTSQHFQPVGRGVSVMNIGLPPQMQQMQARPGHPVHPLPSQAIPLPIALPNSQIASRPPMPQPNAQTPNSYLPGIGGPGTPLPSPLAFASSSYGQLQVNYNATTQYQPISQMNAPPIPPGGQLRLSSEGQSTASVTPLRHPGEHPHPSITTTTVLATSIQPNHAEETPSDWIDHTSADGRRYYYNKKTKQSSWEKPFELMTLIERADATTDWKEFTSPEGTKYYYNKVTNQSKWKIPEELKLARERAEKTSIKGTQSEMLSNSHAPDPESPIVVKASSSTDTSSSKAQVVASSPVPAAPVVTASDPQSLMVSESSASTVVASTGTTKADGTQTQANTVTPDAAMLGSDGVAHTMVNTVETSINKIINDSAQDILSSVDGVAQDTKEARKDEVIADKVNDAALDEKAFGHDPLNYENKLEAKSAFKALLESANVGPDWTWDQAMRVIINDRRYGALKTLGERKQAFNEFLGQRKKQEAEERRIRQKKSREVFKKMLEESKELTSSTRWSKAAAIFEDDDRFKAVERERDRKDLFENYLEELEKKERAKAQEERKRNLMEYRQFLESCDFIKASSQWRKVQDRLEVDDRCSRLDKIDRLEIFQDYLRDLEKEEEEQRKMQKEELRKAERKNRDEFRKLMEEHVASGTLTAKTHWRDYCMKVKNIPAYVAVASNTSGSTPKDLFEDVAEELQKQYHDDKTRIKDAVKLGKISLSSTWTLEDFKAAILEDVDSPPISDINFKLVFDELLERVREKEEKEAKKRKRLADDFFDLLCSVKEITASSKWEDCKQLFEGCQEYSSIEEESFCMEIFEEYITKLKEQAKENERRRKQEKAKTEKEREERERRKGKQRREKEKEHESKKEERFNKDGVDNENADIDEIHVGSEDRRSGKDNNEKQRKRHQSAVDSVNEIEEERSKKSHRHSSSRKKSRRRASTPESDSESRHKKHKRDHRNGSRRSGDHEELEDGEFGKDGESW